MPNYNGIYANEAFPDRIRNRAREMIRRTFKRAVTYKELDKYNSDGTITEDYPIQVAKSSNKLKKYKNFISHPDYPVTYGDIFKLVEDYLIVVDLNDSNQISEDGIMYKCNDTLKWKVDGITYEQPCFIDYKSVSTDDSGRYNKFSTNRILLYTQVTDDISGFTVNQEFVFGNTFKNVYRVINLNDTDRDGLAIITLELAQASPNDDLDDNVADNPNSDENVLRVDSTLDDTYYLVSPKSSEIRLYSSVDYSITHYDSLDNQLSTTFTFNITGIDNSSYDMTNVTSNGFTITSISEGGLGALEITNTDNSEVISLDIELRGLF